MHIKAVRLDKASAHTAETRVYSDEPFTYPTLLTTSSRRHERKQRAANQASAKSNRSQMACKGRCSRKAAAQEPERRQPIAHSLACQPLWLLCRCLSGAPALAYHLGAVALLKQIASQSRRTLNQKPKGTPAARRSSPVSSPDCKHATRARSS